MSSTCSQCRLPYEVTQEDRDFHDKVSPVIGGKKYAIPAPTMCPTCRWQRRLMFRNERNLYHRKCDLSGRSMISMHPADTPFPVYHISEWMTDKWDPKEFGRPFDFSRPFNEQFADLCAAVPHFSAFVDPQMDQNSEYTNCSSEAKNCYMVTQAEKNEDCYYGRGINNCKNCCDCLRVYRCELCYECISARNCYACLFCSDCDNCSDCYFSTELRGCRNCFGCHGLTQKEYHVFNKPVSPEEWKKTVAELTLSHTVISQMRERSAKTRLQVPQRATHIIQCENSTGDDLLECRGATQCFDSNKLEHCSYCYELANGAKDCHDFSMFGLNCELCYECSGGGYGMYHVLFSNHCWNNVSELLYCESCFPNVKNCFGCFGLKRAEYCILNKQYTKREYEELVPKIIEHMKKSGEWGQFFDPKICAYAYNESLASEFFPLAKEEVLKRGWNWRDEAPGSENYMGPDVDVPETIKEVNDGVCEKILRCKKTGKPYRITQQELAFYRRFGIPLPRLSPQTRHLERMAARRPRMLWERECAQCKKKTTSSISPKNPEIVWCDDCYRNYSV